jgi:hypothetical protein
MFCYPKQRIEAEGVNNSSLRGIFGPETEEVMGGWIKCAMVFVICGPS